MVAIKLVADCPENWMNHIQKVAHSDICSVFGVFVGKCNGHHLPAPRKLKLFFTFQGNADPQISLLLCKQWTLYAVTPLYKFSYGQLKEYSRQLSRFIATESQRRPVEMEYELQFKVTFSSFSALKITEQEPDAVLIQVGTIVPIF